MKDVRISSIIQSLKKAKDLTTKIARDAFLYFDPTGNKNQFAQCSTCRDWTGAKQNTCYILGKNVKVTGSMSCGLYVPGKPKPEYAGKEYPALSPKQAGLVDTNTRCENCKYYESEDSHCHLFMMLNEDMKATFKLDEKVHKQGCCNAFTEKK